MTARAKARKRIELLEAFVTAFDAMVASGTLANRLKTPETRERFELARMRLQAARERIAADG